MKRETSKPGKTERTVCRRLKPFTLVGAAIALGLVGFDPDDAIRREPVEQQQEVAQDVRDLGNIAPEGDLDTIDAFFITK